MKATHLHVSRSRRTLGLHGGYQEDRTCGSRCPMAVCRGRAEPAPAQAEAEPLRISCLKGGFLELQRLQWQGTQRHDLLLPEEQPSTGSTGAGAGTSSSDEVVTRIH